MKVIKAIIISLFLIIQASSLTFAQNQDLLKFSDVNKIMGQILEHHVDKKEVTAAIIQNSIKIYIDQFDPDRIYLLDSEVAPYFKLSKTDLAQIVEQYKKEDFSIYNRINDVIEKSIFRSREIRKDLEKTPANLFTSVRQPKVTGKVELLDPDINRPFAKNEAELKERIQANITTFIDNEETRYGINKILEREPEVLLTYERRLHSTEHSYLYLDDQGKRLSEAQQEHFLTMHILKSLASSLDAHTKFMDSNEANEMRMHLEKEFYGIGVTLQERLDAVYIVNIIPGSPADKNGQIKINDQLVEIDGKSLKDISFDNVLDEMQGKNGSEVKLVLKRTVEKGELPMVIRTKVDRGPIILNDNRVDVSYESFGDGIIGKIVLHGFYEGEKNISSEKDVRAAIKDLNKRGKVRGIILDMRENSGGYLTQAVKVAGLFISSGVVVISKYFNGEEHFYRDIDAKPEYNGPLVILTSRATASAAEIVAQALQDYGVAIIVGDDHTYGKGTIQTQTVTENKNTPAFKVTVGKYYTVSGKTPQMRGVLADVVVPGPYMNEHIGEQYLENPLSPDTIPAAYDDKLADIDSGSKAWYLKYYTPSLQHQTNYWSKMIPVLKKNSDYRLIHNKNYQLFLKIERGEKIDKAEEDEYTANTNKQGFGAEDLQMAEAVNVVKDMVILQSRADAHALTGK